MSKKLTEEQRKKLRRIMRKRRMRPSPLKGRKRPAEVGAKVSKALRGRKKSKEWLRNISDALRGRPCPQLETPQARKRQRESVRTYWDSLSPEERSEKVKTLHAHLRNARAKTKLKPLSEKQRQALAQLSEKSRAWFASLTPEEYDAWRKKLSEKAKKRTQSTETREKLSQIAKERHAMRKEWEVEGTASGTGFVPFATFNRKRKKPHKKPYQSAQGENE